eukprot:6727668-Alexandrium_andersonii.AAC.1
MPRVLASQGCISAAPSATFTAVPGARSNALPCGGLSGAWVLELPGQPGPPQAAPRRQPGDG